MNLNENEIQFLHRFIGHTDIRLFVEEEFLLAIGLHERFSEELHIPINRRTSHDCK